MTYKLKQQFITNTQPNGTTFLLTVKGMPGTPAVDRDEVVTMCTPAGIVGGTCTPAGIVEGGWIAGLPVAEG